MWNDDQKIEIAVRSGITPCVGAKKPDAIRIKGCGEALRNGERSGWNGG